MSEQEILVHWLTRAGRRLQVHRRLRELSAAASMLLGVLVLYLLLRAAPLPRAILDALVPLLALSAVAAVLVCCLRSMRPLDLARVASRADADAGLRDELTSACWFVQRNDRSGPVASMLRHAAREVQRIEPHELFPLSAPRSVLAVLGLAAAAAWLATFPAGSAGSRTGRHAGESTLESASAASISRQPSPGTDQTLRSSALSWSLQPEKRRNEEAVWSRAEEAARRLDNSADRDALQRAVQARDTKRVTQLLEAAQLASPAGQAARPEGHQLSAEVAQGILDRLRELIAQDAEPGSGEPKADAEQSSLRISPQQTNAAQESQRPDSAHHDDAESAFNAALRAMSLAGAGQREAIRGRGEAQGWQEGDAANLNSGAMGRRIGVSQAGAGNGEAPPANPTGDPEAAPVLGKQTLRLAAQLQRVNSGGTPVERDEGTPEAFYAATQAQASRLESREVRGPAHTAAEAALQRQETPLAYRSAVKKYFLTEHRKED